MNSKEWLDGLKAGDEVIVTNRSARFVAKVQRRTATQIIVVTGNNLEGKEIATRFRAIDGLTVGGSIWDTESISEPTPEARDSIVFHKYGAAIQSALGKIKVPATLEKRIELYNAIKALPHQAGAE